MMKSCTLSKESCQARVPASQRWLSASRTCTEASPHKVLSLSPASLFTVTQHRYYNIMRKELGSTKVPGEANLARMKRIQRSILAPKSERLPGQFVVQLKRSQRPQRHRMCQKKDQEPSPTASTPARNITAKECASTVITTPRGAKSRAAHHQWRSLSTSEPL